MMVTFMKLGQSRVQDWIIEYFIIWNNHGPTVNETLCPVFIFERLFNTLPELRKVIDIAIFVPVLPNNAKASINVIMSVSYW